MPDVDNLLTSFYQLDDEARKEVVETIPFKLQYHKDNKRPEPTVLSPSRFVGNIITMLFHIFHWILSLYSSISAVLFETFKFFRTKIEPQNNYSIFRITLNFYFLCPQFLYNSK